MCVTKTSEGGKPPACQFQGAGLGGNVHTTAHTHSPKEPQMEIWPFLCPGVNLPSVQVGEASEAKNVGT